MTFIQYSRGVLNFMMINLQIYCSCRFQDNSWAGCGASIPLKYAARERDREGSDDHCLPKGHQIVEVLDEWRRGGFQCGHSSSKSCRDHNFEIRKENR